MPVGSTLITAGQDLHGCGCSGFAAPNQDAGWTWMVRVQVCCGGPWGSPANGAVVVETVAVPGRRALQVAVSAPWSSSCEVHSRTAAALVVIDCHGWVGEGWVVMVRCWPTRRHTGLGCSPKRAVMLAGAGEQSGSTGSGAVEVPGGPGRAVPAGAAEPRELGLLRAPEGTPAPAPASEPAAAQAASMASNPPTSSVLVPNGSSGVPGMKASPGCTRVFGGPSRWQGSVVGRGAGRVRSTNRVAGDAGRWGRRSGRPHRVSFRRVL